MIYVDKNRQSFHLFCRDFSYYLKVQDQELIHLYYGKPLAKTLEEAKALDLSYLLESYPSGSSFELKPQHLPFEVPSSGAGWYGNSALKARNEQGNDLTCLTYDSYRILSSKPSLLPLPFTGMGEELETLEITLKDPLTHLTACLYYTIVGDETSGYGLSRSMKVINQGDSPLTLTHMASMVCPVMLSGTAVTMSDWDVVHLKGAWARERSIVRTRLGGAEYRVESQRGASGHDENPFVALCEASATEDQGAVYGFSLLYSGSFLASLTMNDAHFASVFLGLNPAIHEAVLDPSESFQTPEALLVYSDQGFGKMSHIFHGVFRDHLCQSPYVHQERPVLINNWEAMYFGLNEEKILNLAKSAKDLGVELLVMDDGWFGKRNDDTSSLGDWTVNEEKLPNGLKSLAEKVRETGLLFGLWVEPEMISPRSLLYEEHPDWCLHVEGRNRTEGRNQLILDLSRKDVQDHLIKVLSDLFSSAPISYIKWDMNRNMTESFSALLEPRRQKETQHRYMLGLYRVLGEITSKFPHILFESCSGGGGRFDPGMLFFMPQTWTSDDSDAMERLKIQYGTSLVYPSSSMGAHISAVPNHQVGRITPMKTRAEVALSGNFGLELDPAILSEEDKATIKTMISRCKQIRSLTAFGVYDRLLDPFHSNYAAWQFRDEQRVAVFAFRRLSEPNPLPVLLKLKGLEEDALYQTEDGTLYSGSTLMYCGLVIRMPVQDFTSQMILLTKVPTGTERNT